MTRSALAALGLIALTAIGCAKDDSGAPVQEPQAQAPGMTEAATTDRAEMAAKPRPTGRVIKVVDSDYGRVIADRNGEALYLFDKEQSKASQCYGACATAWPPALTKGEPRAGSGAVQRLLGTTRRRDGRLQVTYRGHPLYYYLHDTPGNILCQNVDEFGGLWLVVKPNGSPVT